METFSDRLKEVVDHLPVRDRERVLGEVKKSVLEFFGEENQWKALLEHIKPIIEREKEAIDDCQDEYIKIHFAAGDSFVIVLSDSDDGVPFWMLDSYENHCELLLWVWKPTNKQIDDLDTSKLTWIVEAETRKLAPYHPALRGYIVVDRKWVWQEGNGLFKECSETPVDYYEHTWELLCHRMCRFDTKEEFIEEFGHVFPGVPVLNYNESIETLFETKAVQ